VHEFEFGPQHVAHAASHDAHVHDPEQYFPNGQLPAFAHSTHCDPPPMTFGAAHVAHAYCPGPLHVAHDESHDAHVPEFKYRPGTHDKQFVEETIQLAQLESHGKHVPDPESYCPSEQIPWANSTARWLNDTKATNAASARAIDRIRARGIVNSQRRDEFVDDTIARHTNVVTV